MGNCVSRCSYAGWVAYQYYDLKPSFIALEDINTQELHFALKFNNCILSDMEKYKVFDGNIKINYTFDEFYKTVEYIK